MFQNGNFTFLLTSSGQEWQFHMYTDILWSGMAISHLYWHLVVKKAILDCYWHIVFQNGNFTFLLTSIGQEWLFHMSTDIYWSRMAISHCYWHLMVRNSNFTFILTFSGPQGYFRLQLTYSVPEWQFHIPTDIYWSRMAISHVYWHVVVQNGNFTFILTSSGQQGYFRLLLTYSGQEWQFYIATDI